MRYVLPVAFAVCVGVAQPAAAQVLGATNVDVTSPTTFNLAGNTFTFDFDPIAQAAFDPNTYSVQTTGTAQTSAFFGQPSLFFTSANIFIDGNLFPSFASIPTLSEIPFSLTPGDLALRYGVGSDFYYGYARLNGDGTLDFAFQSQANTGITAGAAITGPLAAPAVPEPATWAMMLGGFGAIGVALRRRRRKVFSPALA